MSDTPPPLRQRLTDTPNPRAVEPTPRTLPVGPIPLVAFDAIIEEGWGDSVAQSLNNLTERVGWMTWPDDTGTRPPSDIPAPASSSMTSWLEPELELFVPDWASVTLVHTQIDAVKEDTGGPNTYDVQLSIGGITSLRITRQTAPVAAGQWFPVAWSCLIDLSTLSGYQSVQILARRAAGSGTWIFDHTLSAVVLSPAFLGAIGWYGE